MSQNSNNHVGIVYNYIWNKDGYKRLFLKHNPEFPEVETIEIIKGKLPITVNECNGFCGLNDDN